MAINFPENPALDDLFVDGSGVEWQCISAVVGDVQWARTGKANTGGGIMPVGSIVMFAGTIANIPAEWHICDGAGGTVDLRGRFIFGTDVQADIGVTGGSSDATLPSHNHVFTGDELPEHDHDIGRWVIGTGGGSGTYTDDVDARGKVFPSSAGTPSGSISSAGTSAIGANNPPFYKLAYIQRVS